MQTSKYVTIDYIKEQANNILFFENVLSKEKIAELVWGVITRLGDPSLLITRVTNGVNGPKPINIINHKGLLPLDLVEMVNHTLRNYNTKIKLIPTSNPFFLSDMNETIEREDIPMGEVTTQIEDEDIVTTTTSDYYSPLNAGVTVGIVDKYMVQDGEIITTMEEGELELTYKAFPLDNNGFPKIPDNPKLIELIKWSILERAGIQLWYQDKLTERKYNHIESKYLYYKKAASNQLKINSIPEMEAFKNRFMRLNIDPNLYGNDFINYGYEDNYNIQGW